MAVDYFTKWPEAKAVASITTNTAKSFIMEHIVCKFGCPHTIITDNGAQFTSDSFKKFCKEWNITISLTSVAYPQSNGMAELTNRNIVRGLCTRLEGKAGTWADDLPYVLWSMRTTYKMATGQTPFLLTYGSEAVLPIELAIPTDRVSSFDPGRNEEAVAAGVDLLEEARDEAALRAEAFKQSMINYHRRSVKSKNFQVGDLVLRNVSATGKHVSKLGEKWDGPFTVTAFVPPATYRLKTPQGRPLKRPWNAIHLKKYYP